MLSYIYATVECCGTFLLFKVVWANHFPNDEVKDDCLKLDWFSSDMGNSIKKSFEAFKTIGSLDDLILEESAWSFMALNSIFGMLENRESRGDRRVKIAGNTGLPRKKSSSL